MQIPKLSAPLVKDIRTGEGIFEWVLSAAIAASAVTDRMSFGHAGTYLTIVAGIKGVRRLFIKLVAVQGVAGIGAPDTKVADEIAAVVAPAAAAAAAAPVPVAPAPPAA